jgi:hypothetical protein
VALVISDNKIINGIVVDVFLYSSISIVGNGNASLVSCSFTASKCESYIWQFPLKQFVGFQTAVFGE